MYVTGALFPVLVCSRWKITQELGASMGLWLSERPVENISEV
jgi:hypothetical protein